MSKIITEKSTNIYDSFDSKSLVGRNGRVAVVGLSGKINVYGITMWRF